MMQEKSKLIDRIGSVTESIAYWTLMFGLLYAVTMAISLAIGFAIGA